MLKQAHSEHQEHLHLFWPSFTTEVAPLLHTRGRDLGSLLAEGELLAGRTQLWRVRAAQAFAFVTVTQHRVSDKEKQTVSEQGKTCWMQE